MKMNFLPFLKKGKLIISVSLFLTFLLGQLIRLQAQSCAGQPNSHPVTEYGTFTANLTDASTISKNNATINNAIVTLGKAGGGIILLPAGTFYIGPDPGQADRAITIAYDNITLCGEGVGKTILKTNGTYAVINGGVRRGHGIIIQGTSNCSAPRKNITLKNFELDGQHGWTGDYGWPADPATGKGWDISHKGIVPSWDACVDNVLMENLYVHHYSGEILYVGGMSMGKLVVRNVRAENTNGSDLNLYAADLLAENCTFGGPSRFWMELTARRNLGGYPDNRTIVRNCTFENAVGATAIVMCQGDAGEYAFEFKNNTLAKCPGVFALYGGVGGPVTISGNTITDCGTALEFGSTPNWVNSDRNANVLFENNTITRGGSLVSFSATERNVIVRNNTFTGKSATSLGASTAAFFGAADLQNCLVENNTFQDCRTPEQTAGISGTRPLFRNNIYKNVERRDTKGQFYLSASSPKATPQFEELVLNGDANIVAQLENKQYRHGQPLKVTGGSASKPIRFAVGQASYKVAQDRYLNGTTTLHFLYDSTKSVWTEDLSTPVITETVQRSLLLSACSSGNRLKIKYFIPYSFGSGSCSISIYSLQGALLYETDPVIIRTGEESFIEIDELSLSPGIYLCKMTLENDTKTVRFLVNNRQ